MNDSQNQADDDQEINRRRSHCLVPAVAADLTPITEDIASGDGNDDIGIDGGCGGGSRSIAVVRPITRTIATTTTTTTVTGTGVHVATVLYRVDDASSKLRILDPNIDQSDGVRFIEYSTYSNRLMTFTDAAMGPSWSDVYPWIDASSLAKAGFFRWRNRDKVRCFSCGIVLCRWRVDDIPLWEHIRGKPSCQFAFHALLRQEVEDEDDATAAQRRVRVRRQAVAAVATDGGRLSTKRARRRTFPATAATTMPDFAAMVNAGLYYRGDDEAACFACGCVFSNWAATKSPFVEHCIGSPYFPFVRSLIPNDDDDDDEDKENIRFPKFASRRARVRSFGSWWLAESMADAGFFQVNDRDRVRCYICGGTLCDLPNCAAAADGIECGGINGGDESESSSYTPTQLHDFWFPRCAGSLRRRR